MKSRKVLMFSILVAMVAQLVWAGEVPFSAEDFLQEHFQRLNAYLFKQDASSAPAVLLCEMTENPTYRQEDGTLYPEVEERITILKEIVPTLEKMKMYFSEKEDSRLIHEIANEMAQSTWFHCRLGSSELQFPSGDSELQFLQSLRRLKEMNFHIPHIFFENELDAIEKWNDEREEQIAKLASGDEADQEEIYTIAYQSKDSFAIRALRGFETERAADTLFHIALDGSRDAKIALFGMSTNLAIPRLKQLLEAPSYDSKASVVGELGRYYVTPDWEDYLLGLLQQYPPQFGVFSELLYALRKVGSSKTLAVLRDLQEEMPEVVKVLNFEYTLAVVQKRAEEGKELSREEYDMEKMRKKYGEDVEITFLSAEDEGYRAQQPKKPETGFRTLMAWELPPLGSDEYYRYEKQRQRAYHREYWRKKRIEAFLE